jgi:uncharacterized membrane protein
MDIELIKKSITDNILQLIVIICIIVTVIGIILSFTKKVIFYSDYNDLGLSLAVFAVPVVLMIIIQQFGGMGIIAAFVLISLTVGLLTLLGYKTWVANDRRILPTIIVVPSKLILSFLYVIYLFSALTGKKRRERGQSWFVLIILTPLMLSLVHTQEGRFRLSSTGRLRWL